MATLSRSASSAADARAVQALLLASRSAAMSLATRVALRCVNRALWRGVLFAGCALALHDAPPLSAFADDCPLRVRPWAVTRLGGFGIRRFGCM